MRCYHCHEPVPSNVDISIALGGEPRAMCCPGCAAIAQLISDTGLDHYYDAREGAGLKPEPTQRDWTVFDRESVRNALTSELGDTREVILQLGGIRCAACSWLIERSLESVQGVEDLLVNVTAARATVRFDPQTLPLSKLLSQFHALGFPPRPLRPDEVHQSQRSEQAAALRRLAVAGIGMMQVMMYAVALYAGDFQDMDGATRDFLRLFALLVSTPVVLYAGAPFFLGAWRDLRHRQLSMDVPVALALGATWGLSLWQTATGGAEVYFDSAVMFVFLLSLARWLEMRMRHRATAIGRAGGDDTSHVVQRHEPVANRFSEVGTLELEPGDRIRVLPDEAVPVDGVLHTAATVDETIRSGESRPIYKAAGEAILAGAIVVGSPAEIIVESPVGQSTLAAMGRLLERARSMRPARQQRANQWAARIVAAVLLVAGGTAIFWSLVDASRAFEATVAVLIVTCPCALSLATPTALSAALSALYRKGILVIRPNALEAIEKVDRLLFDKTGTLSKRRPRLELRVIDPEHKPEPARVAAALEQYSKHPLAEAFALPGPLPSFDAVYEIPGEGIAGELAGRRYQLGKPSADGAEPIIELRCDNNLIAEFVVSEQLRPDARAAIRSLARPTEIVSGDHPTAVQRASEALGVESWLARQNPQDKLLRLQHLRDEGHRVAMIGDGSNDAPVLAAADVSIAMGAASALSSQQADIVILSDRVASVKELFDTASRLERTIRHNFIWAASYNLAAVPAAAAGLVPPWLAAIGMCASSLLVVSNSARLARGEQRAELANGREPTEWAPA